MAGNIIGNYAPDDFTIVLSKGDFIHRITGFADGTFVSMDRLVPTSEPYQGAGDNSQGRVKRRITSMNVTITLSQYSPSNSVLQQLQLADANTPGNEWVFAVTMRDLSGQTVASTNSAIIQAPPTAAFSTTTETRDWNIYMFGSDLFIGGNMLLDDANVAAIQATGGEVDPRWVLGNQ
ncbi:hypothetical protein D3C85_173480 [compost metagenome]